MIPVPIRKSYLSLKKVTSRVSWRRIERFQTRAHNCASHAHERFMASSRVAAQHPPTSRTSASNNSASIQISDLHCLLSIPPSVRIDCEQSDRVSSDLKEPRIISARRVKSERFTEPQAIPSKANLLVRLGIQPSRLTVGSRIQAMILRLSSVRKSPRSNVRPTRHPDHVARLRDKP